mmetsp:Transcript_125202/g.297108  ORF Transcript_125202/g.297108 Transcript_125202/m.297108 type:complete len:241 (+) Transcript_125202:663-1385(+)
MASSSASDILAARAGWPASRTSSTFCKACFSSFAPFTWPTISRSTFFNRFSHCSASAKINSKLIVSISRTGSTVSSTCVTFSSSKHRMTCTMASTFRMLARNWLPRPSPFEAPLTRPAISTYSIISWMVFSDFARLASFSSRSSGTLALPMLGSMVQKGKLPASASPVSHSALNRVLLPTLGRPTMPVFNPLHCTRARPGVTRIREPANDAGFDDLRTPATAARSAQVPVACLSQRSLDA